MLNNKDNHPIFYYKRMEFVVEINSSIARFVQEFSLKTKKYRLWNLEKMLQSAIQDLFLIHLPEIVFQ